MDKHCDNNEKISKVKMVGLAVANVNNFAKVDNNCAFWTCGMAVANDVVDNNGEEEYIRLYVCIAGRTQDNNWCNRCDNIVWFNDCVYNDCWVDKWDKIPDKVVEMVWVNKESESEALVTSSSCKVKMVFGYWVIICVT